MSKEEAKVVVREPAAKPLVHGFQSDEAKAEAVKKVEAVEETGEPELAEVAHNLPMKATAMDLSEMDKLVRIRPRETIPSMRVGPRFFSFTAGKETLVPKYVQLHMEEKGLL